MAALFGFIEESHEKLKQGPALYQTSLLYKTQITKTRKHIQNYRVKILKLAFIFLEFTDCNEVELSHKKSNFATPTSMMNLRKQKNK